MDLEQFLNTTNGIIKRGSETYFNMQAILEGFSKTHLDEFKLHESVLLTPFYLDDGTYEMYWLELNITIDSDDVIPCDAVMINSDHPYVEKGVIKDYIETFFQNEELIGELEKVFMKPFDKKKLYFAVY